MPLLNIQDVLDAHSPGLTIEAGARCHVLAAGQGIISPLYSDPDLTLTTANPLEGSAGGQFPIVWVFAGHYRIVIRDRREDLIIDIDDIEISDSEITENIEFDFPGVDDLLADINLTYATGPGLWTVSPGQLLQVNDIDAVYLVAPQTDENHPLETAGGVKLHVVRNAYGYNVQAFGAKGDGVTDDSAAIQRAINCAAMNGGGRVILPVGHYRSANTICVCHSVENPDFPESPLQAGRLTIEGDGAMTRRDYERDTFSGSVIHFDAGHRLELSKTGLDNQRGWRLQLRDLSILGANGTVVHHPFAASFFDLVRLFVGNDGAVNGEATVYISDNYVGRLRDIEIIGDKALTDKNGIGLHIDPSDTAGGSNSYTNITAAFFDEAIMIGRTYDPTRLQLTDNSKANVAINLQGQFSNIGIHLMQGCTNMSLLGSWAEHCSSAPFVIDNSARNIELVSSNATMDTSAGTGLRGLVVLGGDSGTAGQDSVYNVTLRNNNFFCTAGIAGVFVHDAARDVQIENNSFQNGGGCAMALAGGFGGEMSLRSNNYFPETAPSEVIPGRRICQIGGTASAPTYTDVAHMALELDFRPVALTQDIDASGWRRPPRELIMDTLSGSRTVTLPDLRSAGGRLARVLVMKPYGANTITIDAQSPNQIKGNQTLTLTGPYKAIELMHGGNGSNRWDVVQETG